MLWQQLHTCYCEDAYHPLTNPKVIKLFHLFEVSSQRLTIDNAIYAVASILHFIFIRRLDFRLQGCRRHRPNGCAEYAADLAEQMGVDGGRPRVTDCPLACLTLPVLTLLRKISSHIDLIRVHDRQWYEKVRDAQRGGCGHCLCACTV